MPQVFAPEAVALFQNGAGMDRLHHPRFPRASTYEADWLLALDMGPNPLWLLEDLLADVVIAPGAKVLDLGSGRGATSVFLARECHAEVWAVDLWIGIEAAEATFRDAGVATSVHAVQADARALPFDDDFFDVVISIDAWEYFGTDDHFLPRLLRVLRPGGRIGMATPAMAVDVRDLDAIPPHIAEAVGWEALAWHPAEWWEQQWRLTGLVHDIWARTQTGGGADWLRWARAAGATSSVRMLERDAGGLLSFSLVSATKTSTEPG